MLAGVSECRVRLISLKCNEIYIRYFLDIISLNGETSTSSYYCVSLLILLLTEKLRLLSFFYPNNLLNSFLFDKFPDVYSLYTFMRLW